MHSGAEASSSSTLENGPDSHVGSGSQGHQVGRGDRHSAFGDLDNDVVDRTDAGVTQISMAAHKQLDDNQDSANVHCLTESFLFLPWVLSSRMYLHVSVRMQTSDLSKAQGANVSDVYLAE